MSGGTVPLRLILLILLFSLIPPARASYVAPKQIWTNKWDNCFAAAGKTFSDMWRQLELPWVIQCRIP